MGSERDCRKSCAILVAIFKALPTFAAFRVGRAGGQLSTVDIS